MSLEDRLRGFWFPLLRSHDDPAKVTTIINPVTVHDVERYAGPFLRAYVAAEDAVAEADAMGRHLEAAAGRAIHGARWAAVVASEKRRACSPCDGCGAPSCPCTDVPI